MSDRPRLEACYFDQATEGSFARLARVLEMTAAEHCASWQRSITKIPKPAFGAPTGVQSHVHNTQKFDHWARVVHAAPEGERILLLDADVAILRPLDDAWEWAFDLLYTTKPHLFPFNLGVVFVRVNDRTRTFFARWQAQNRALLSDPVNARVWRRQYGGINQAAFGRLLEAGALSDLSVQTVPCAEWNCEESGWATFDPAVTRILHIKGALRRGLLGREKVTPDRAAAAQCWRELERRSRVDMARPA